MSLVQLRPEAPFAGVAHLVERDLAKVEVASSSLVARSKKERHPHGCLSFLEQHFCYAKVVACGRVIEREWGNPSKVPPSHSPFLAMCRGADNKICTQSQKKHHPSGWCFLFGMPRAGLNLLPRPVRSALNQEVRQGSCEWLCHSWDAGSESSLVTFFAFAVGGSADNKTCGQLQVNELRFSNSFVEKRSSSYLQRLDLSGLFYFADWRQAQQNSQNAERLILCKIAI